LGEARPIRKQVFLPVPENRVFCSRDSRNTPPKKETGVFKTFYKRWERSNRCFDIRLFFKAYFFHPNRFFFNRRGLIFFRGQFFFFNRRGLIFFREERATGIFSQPLTHPPTCLPAPSPSLLTEKKEGGRGRAAPPRAGRGGAPVWTGP
jgi:hypothetical protein